MTLETSGRLPAIHRIPPTNYAPPLVSWEEYLRWALANEFPSEWVDGRIVDVVPQNLRSNLIVQFLLKVIEPHVKPRNTELLIFNFLMWLPNRPSARVPDLMYVSDGHMGRLTDTYLDGPADLAIEVVSLDSLIRDRREKYLEYEAGGVREYWLIDEYREEARFYVLSVNGQYQEAPLSVDGVYASTVLPGLQLSVDQVWHEPFASFREHVPSGSSDPTSPIRRTRVTTQRNGRRSPPSYKPPKVSWDEFLDWRRTYEGRAEWVDGEIIEIVRDNFQHYFVVHLLASLLSRYVDSERLGLVFIETILMKISSRPTGRMPDILFLADDHLGQMKDTYVDGPADLVVEVVSPDSEIRGHDEKFVEYEAAGIPEYWLIDVARHEAHFYVLNAQGQYREEAVGEDGIYTSTVLPGLRVRVDWLWRDPLPTLDEALADLG